MRGFVGSRVPERTSGAVMAAQHRASGAKLHKPGGTTGAEASGLERPARSGVIPRFEAALMGGLARKDWHDARAGPIPRMRRGEPQTAGPGGKPGPEGGAAEPHTGGSVRSREMEAFLGGAAAAVMSPTEGGQTPDAGIAAPDAALPPIHSPRGGRNHGGAGRHHGTCKTPQGNRRRRPVQQRQRY